jgi:hypothetical protein
MGLMVAKEECSYKFERICAKRLSRNEKIKKFFFLNKVASVCYERNLEGLIVSGASVGESYHQEWFVPSERNFR